jgi:hypothetical protein
VLRLNRPLLRRNRLLLHLNLPVEVGVLHRLLGLNRLGEGLHQSRLGNGVA